MLTQKVKHEIGLSAVMGALLVSWFGAGLPALNATLVGIPMEYENVVGLYETDADRDGIPDSNDPSPFGR